MDLINQGLRAQQAGDIETAIDLYRQSLDLFPTAEGHTYLGWALSYQEKLEEAIDECRRAIELDPDFGNPYNDIGVYLMQRNRPDEAIPWLEKAKQASRYEPRHFPYLNLGHIYAARGELIAAIAEYEAARRLVPEDPRIQRHIESLRGRLN